jgi:hypothetical protein
LLDAEVLREMVHVRMRALAAEATADHIPAWLVHWQVHSTDVHDCFDARSLVE